MKRTLSLIASAATLALALTACGSSTGEGNSASPGTNSLEQVKESGVLTVGTEGTYRPFSYHEGDKLTGYDVEVMQAVGEKLGVKVDFKETQWDAVFTGLEAKRFDAIANQVTINEKRQESYLFSEPYSVTTGVVVTASDNTEIKSFEDLKGKRTAQSQTSNWYEAAKELGATVEPVEGWAQSLTLLKQGRVDATINDKLSYLDSQKQQPDESIKIAAEAPEKNKAGVALRKDSAELRDAIDDALDELRSEGTLAKISEKYFGEDISK
ncbi:amino acid ABC transporter substrate-binding protein [Glutamicibacter endophyticus]|uniref:amino acid ABC transporter substrate-binding protein n=1 Tax=Glutamicibacter endophyticus TaxID=1522174 RepID=UPI003AF1D06D